MSEAKSCALCGGNDHQTKDCRWKRNAALSRGMRGRAPEDYQPEAGERLDEVRHLFPCLPGDNND